MKNKNDSFYGQLKIKINQTPPKSLDQKILMIAKKELNDNKKSFDWMMTTILASACIIVFLVGYPYLMNRKPHDSYVFTEAPEMILNYNNRELMADATKLNASDWEKIEGSK
jgi:quinol-cytochrome oxidoreductase complex cytochrome b subunit